MTFSLINTLYLHSTVLHSITLYLHSIYILLHSIFQVLTLLSTNLTWMKSLFASFVVHTTQTDVTHNSTALLTGGPPGIKQKKGGPVPLISKIPSWEEVVVGKYYGAL